MQCAKTTKATNNIVCLVIYLNTSEIHLDYFIYLIVSFCKQNSKTKKKFTATEIIKKQNNLIKKSNLSKILLKTS